MIDKVEVKQLQDLSPREIEHDNPEIRRPEEMATFLSQLYNREVAPESTVTVIRFSQSSLALAAQVANPLARIHDARRSLKAAASRPRSQ